MTDDLQPLDPDWLGGDDTSLDVVEEEDRRRRGGLWWWVASAVAVLLLFGLYWSAGMDRNGDVPGDNHGVIEQRVPGVALPRTDEGLEVPGDVDGLEGTDGIGRSGPDDSGSGGPGQAGDGNQPGSGPAGDEDGSDQPDGDVGSEQPGGGEAGGPDDGGTPSPRPSPSPDAPNVDESERPDEPAPRPTVTPSPVPTVSPTATPSPVPTTTPTALPSQPPLPSPSPSPSYPVLSAPIQLRDFTPFGPQDVRLFPIREFDPPWAARTTGRLYNPNTGHGAVDLYLECGQLGALDSCATGTDEAEQFDDLMFRICVSGDPNCYEGPMASFRVNGISVPPFSGGRGVTFDVWLKDTDAEQVQGVTTPFNIVIRSLVG